VNNLVKFVSGVLFKKALNYRFYEIRKIDSRRIFVLVDSSFLGFINL